MLKYNQSMFSKWSKGKLQRDVTVNLSLDGAAHVLPVGGGVHLRERRLKERAIRR